MNESHDHQSTATQPPGKSRRRLFRILPPALVILGLVGAVILVRTAPRAERKQPPPMRSLVRVVQPEPSDQPVIVRAMGSVIPAREVDLKSRVTGEVIWTHPEFKEGARFKEGELLVRIDPADYEIALARAKGQVAQANFEYQIELGRQDVARREWNLIGKDRPASEREEYLALRQPQLQNVQAGLASARAALKQAELNLARTELSTPFNALLRHRQTEVGSVANLQEPVAALVGTDEFWVRVSIPVDRLGVLGDLQQPATIYLSRDRSVSWRGRVIRLLGDLEQNGRMARLLVSVPDPLDQHPDTPLLLGSYVHVDLEGERLEKVVVLPRSALREGNHLWLAAADDTLEIRPVDVAWRDTESVYIAGGLARGERVILNDLAIPVSGMPLIIRNSEPEPTRSTPEQ
jgi:RND family efflux transporter MFP subunit